MIVNINYKKFSLHSDSLGNLLKQNLDYKILINAFSRKRVAQNLSSPVSRFSTLRERNKMGVNEESKQMTKITMTLQANK